MSNTTNADDTTQEPTTNFDVIGADAADFTLRSARPGDLLRITTDRGRTDDWTVTAVYRNATGTIFAKVRDGRRKATWVEGVRENSFTDDAPERSIKKQVPASVTRVPEATEVELLAGEGDEQFDDETRSMFTRTGLDIYPVTEEDAEKVDDLIEAEAMLDAYAAEERMKGMDADDTDDNDGGQDTEEDESETYTLDSDDNVREVLSGGLPDGARVEVTYRDTSDVTRTEAGEVDDAEYVPAGTTHGTEPRTWTNDTAFWRVEYTPDDPNKNAHKVAGDKGGVPTVKTEVAGNHANGGTSRKLGDATEITVILPADADADDEGEERLVTDGGTDADEQTVDIREGVDLTDVVDGVVLHDLARSHGMGAGGLKGLLRFPSPDAWGADERDAVEAALREQATRDETTRDDLLRAAYDTGDDEDDDDDDPPTCHHGMMTKGLSNCSADATHTGGSYYPGPVCADHAQAVDDAVPLDADDTDDLDAAREVIAEAVDRVCADHGPGVARWAIEAHAADLADAGVGDCPRVDAIVQQRATSDAPDHTDAPDDGPAMTDGGTEQTETDTAQTVRGLATGAHGTDVAIRFDGDAYAGTVVQTDWHSERLDGLDVKRYTALIELDDGHDEYAVKLSVVDDGFGPFDACARLLDEPRDGSGPAYNVEAVHLADATPADR